MQRPRRLHLPFPASQFRRRRQHAHLLRESQDCNRVLPSVESDIQPNNQTEESGLNDAASLSDASDAPPDALSDTHSEPEDIRVQEIIQEAVAALPMGSVDNNESQQYEEPESEPWLQTMLHPVHPVGNGDSDFHSQLEDSLGDQPAETYIPTTMNDPSEVLVHARAEPDEMLDHFTLALGLWCEKSGISRRHYEALREVLQIPEDIGALRSLPLGLSTLKKKCRAQFPMLPIRRASIPAVSLKMPTLSPAEKRLIQTSLTSNLFFQDPVALLSLLARSPVFRKKIHIGMADLVDNPTELWQSWSWGSSIRCTWNEQEIHIGRIQFVGRDRRLACTKPGEIVLIVQYTITANSFDKRIHSLRPPLCPNELLLLEDQETHIIHEDNILARLDVHLDYTFDGSGSYKPSETNGLFVRRVMNTIRDTSSVQELRLSTPLRGELEIAAYGRDMLIKMLCPGDPIKRTISIPFQLFIDGFGLYRNMYRNITGFYMIPAGLNDSERRRRNNVYTIALGPHATNFPDVVEALAPGLQAVERGFDIVVTGEGTVRVIAPCIAYLGDMPQQNDNAGIKRPTATVSCRSCTVSDAERFNMNFDLVKRGRYHYQLLNLRAEIEAKRTVREREALWKTHGLAKESPPVLKICPALNLVTFFPSDPCHSEFSGLSKIAHTLLISHILTPEGQKEYCQTLQRFPFRRRWARLQSPITHLESYQIQEHARASIVIPIILRFALKPDWIQTVVQQALYNSFGEQSIDPDIPCLLLAKTFGAIARSNSLLTSQTSVGYNELKSVVANARTMLQKVIDATIMAAEAPRSASRAVWMLRSRQNSPVFNQIVTPPTEDISINTVSIAPKAGKMLHALKHRPNMHIGVHYADQAKEYAVPNNCNVLIGEDKHREYKAFVQRTNKRDVEKVLLIHESFKRTISLTLDGALMESEPYITSQMKQLHRECPILMQDLVRSEHNEQQDDDENADEADDSYATTPFHTLINAYCRLPASRKVMELLGLQSARLSELPVTHPFLQKLRLSYSSDWAYQHMLGRGSTPIRLFQKLTFTFNGDAHRTTLKLDDLVEYTRASGTKIGQIRCIFTHNQGSSWRVFFAMFSAHEIRRERVLDLPILQVNRDEIHIIGLPAIRKPSLYTIPVSKDSERLELDSALPTTFLNCTWSVSFL
ncbi:conserved hypothetical protein [Coccidioides posadasii str. Silveira]|uniref:Uncharacterized protein n=1 Tax=Coccidioides posadasii (strain RMSCC 757 / Silveira) TaxID=443226 RepID=E9D280_COCPS|nr:conserved hypothetical protein [Coccidioides posadasii str. Silveira]EFW19294.1 conserved hypothetical protein [Coccidioides posadasii str. Silveira]